MDIAQNGEADGAADVENRMQIVMEGPAEVGEPVTDRVESGFFDESGWQKSVVYRIKYAPACGHAIHGLEDIGSVCSNCSVLSCRKCSEINVCSRCGKSVCPRCAESVKNSDGEEEVLCAECLAAKVGEIIRKFLGIVGLVISGLLFLGILSWSFVS